MHEVMILCDNPSCYKSLTPVPGMVKELGDEFECSGCNKKTTNYATLDAYKKSLKEK